jgi:hypothetical protein
MSLLLPLCLVGCGVLGGASIEGDWSGELDCDEVSFDMEITLEKEDKDDTYSGEGEIEDITCYNSETSWECDLLFEVEAETEGGGGEQDVEFDVDDCEISYDGESQDTDCEDIDDGEWDGEDTITFEASLGSTDCDGELERDD